MKHASLFSGIGGFDYAAKRIGWNNVFHVEKEEYQRSILKKHFSESKGYGDITEFDGKQYGGGADRHPVRRIPLSRHLSRQF